MRKLIALVAILLGFTLTSGAQEIAENAIGLRLGDSNAFGAEISYQRALKENNRLEADFGWRYGTRRGFDFRGVKLTGIYQWVWNIDGGFNWYAGPGAGLSSWRFDLPTGDITDTFLFAAGNVGIEYNFDFPLLVSIDFRPEIGFGSSTYDNNDLDFDIGIGVRYQF
ncbi:hypothetical protein H7U19_11705 [Hyunsoonleella sp. SJ7]|uniref:Outer membrane protein beta-barrel domain-containing protein n=1 Tax=Hyunsoonleella aquatilis TaxID=2762758 RepID=A0A923H8G3_9FLAO|nr:hypothetical protein [Hyunsoonleella aquatilis]MBC3759076.1 hypothetical protein [Hyunsoonleella aquatilis]